MKLIKIIAVMAASIILTNCTTINTPLTSETHTKTPDSKAVQKVLTSHTDEAQHAHIRIY